MVSVEVEVAGIDARHALESALRGKLCVRPIRLQKYFTDDNLMMLTSLGRAENLCLLAESKWLPAKLSISPLVPSSGYHQSCREMSVMDDLKSRHAFAT